MIVIARINRKTYHFTGFLLEGMEITLNIGLAEKFKSIKDAMGEAAKRSFDKDFFYRVWDIIIY